MGFWQDLAVSYAENIDILETKFPLSTTTISNMADIIAVVVLKENGKFIRVEKIEKAEKRNGKTDPATVVSVTMPVTEESSARTGDCPCPHPVFDQYEYLKGSGKKFKAYVVALKNFADSKFATSSVKAIYNYIAQKTIAADLKGLGVNKKTNIVFKVEKPGKPRSEVWKDPDFFTAWHNYYLAKKRQVNNGQAMTLDYVSGEEQLLSISHPKKISNSSANAKLISDNDKTNYTFRGKFRNSSEALSIGYESSQKAHQFLRYLISDRGFYCGEQVILSYTIGKIKKLPAPFYDTKSIFDKYTKNQGQDNKELILRAETGYDYAEALKKALASQSYGKSLGKHRKTAVIALDAATTGRLSITFYRELAETEYLEKIADWHDSCKWHQLSWDKDKKAYKYIGAPSVDKIIEGIYGKPRSGKDESYNKLKKAARERLLRCIFDGECLAKDYMSAAVHRASNPLSITQDGKFSPGNFEKILSTACALVRKFYKQKRKEEYKLTIEHDRQDRDYLYGRLLGAADKLEAYVNDKNDNARTTNAIRYMNAFSQHPFRTWKIIEGSLNPYIQALRGRDVELKEIDKIKGLFKSADFENDAPLSGIYLLSYACERLEIDKLVEELKTKSK
jgi:CRISPR-associated protein Csd1